MKFLINFVIRLVAYSIVWFGGFYAGMLLCSFLVWDTPDFTLPGWYARIGAVWIVIMAAKYGWSKRNESN